CLIAIEAVDDDRANPVGIDGGAHGVCEFPRGYLSRVDLIDEQPAAVAKRLQVDAHALGAAKEQAEHLVENKESDFLTALDRSNSKLQHKKRLACPRGAENKRARSSVDP